MSTWEKMIKFTGITFAAGALLVGCGSGDTSESDSIAASDISTDEEVNLEVWLTPQWKGVYDATEDGADYDSFLLKAAELYEADNPNVNIEVQVIPSDQRNSKLSVALDTDSLPNVFFDSSFALSAWPHQGVALPLNDVISEESRADISETIWDNVTIGDDVYFYPFAQNQGTLVYNAEMFEAAGLSEYVKDADEIASWSTDEFVEILTALKEANPNVSPLGFFSMNEQGDTWNMMYTRAFGNEFYGEDGSIILDESNGVKAFEYINNLNENGLLIGGAESLTSNEVNALFQNQEVAVSFTNTILYNNMLADMNNNVIDSFDARLANVPAAEGVNPPVFTYVLSSIAFDTLDDSENAVAKDFIKFYSEHEDLTNASTNTLPIRSSVSQEFASELPLLEAYNENEKNIINFSNNISGYAELRNVFFPEIQAMLIGDKTPEQAAQDFSTAGSAIIETGKKQSLIAE
jgi:multiple sugar transport system substrate-binding protein